MRIKIFQKNLKLLPFSKEDLFFSEIELISDATSRRNSFPENLTKWSVRLDFPPTVIKSYGGNERKNTHNYKQIEANYPHP